MRYLVLPSGHCIEGERFSPREMFLASFDSPGTTDEARDFGYTSTLAGHGKMPQGQFFAGLCNHPYPKSLWKAYQAGRQQARKELKDRERAWKRQHLEDLRAGRAVSLSGKDHTQDVESVTHVHIWTYPEATIDTAPPTYYRWCDECGYRERCLGDDPWEPVS